MNSLHKWSCRTCGETQATIDLPEHEFCERHDLFTAVPCAVCGMRTRVTPAEIYQARRLKAVHAKCVLVDNESGEKNADMQSLRSRDDSATDRGLAGEGGGRAQREPDHRAEPVADTRLDDDTTDRDSGARGLERGESRDARDDLPGAEVALIAQRCSVVIGQQVEVVDGQGLGTVGTVVDLRVTQFDHVFVTLEADDGSRSTTLEHKVAAA